MSDKELIEQIADISVSLQPLIQYSGDVVAINSRHCTKCKIKKSFSDFHKSKNNKYGLNCQCKDCAKTQNDAHSHTKNGLTARIYNNQKMVSKKRGHQPPNYTLAELRDWFSKQINSNCLYLNWINSGYNKMKSPSCDRLDDYKPYTLDNLQLMTWQKNLDKGNSDKRNGINNKNSKAVIQMSLKGCFKMEFHSTSFAARETGYYQSGISLCCLGKQKISGGYRWMYSLGIPIYNNVIASEKK